MRVREERGSLMLGASPRALVESLTFIITSPSLPSSILSLSLRRPFGSLIIWEKVRDSRCNGIPRRAKITNLRMSRYPTRMAYLTLPHPSLVPLERYR